MGNGTWACFDCREAVRRPTQHTADIPCPKCGRACKYLGTKIPIPIRRNAKAWRQLRERLGELTLAGRERAWIMRVRRRHQLEQAIAKLEAQAKNEGRANTIRQLKKQLADL